MKIGKLLVTTICLITVLNSFGQIHKQVFEYFTKTQIPGKTENFRFFYIIDTSKTVRLKGLYFYAFTFSRDSTEKTGYIGYDKKSGDLFFITDTLNGSKTIIRKLFPLRTNAPLKTGFISCLGDELIKTVKNDTIIFTTRLTGTSKNHDSHSIYLKELWFIKGILYPVSLVFFFPFEDKERIKLISKFQQNN